MKCISAHAPDQHFINQTPCGKEAVDTSVGVPCRDTIRQNALHHITVESPEDADGERDLFQPPQEVQSLLGLFQDP